VSAAPAAAGTPAARHADPVRRWVCCADDYAIDAGAIEGIAALIGQGRVTATSALVEAPLWPSAAAALPANARADIGLHLNLTQAFAQQPDPVWPLAELIARCRLGAISRPGLRARIERQLDAFEDCMGRAPDYVDGHQHVHQFAIVREELLSALVRRYAPALPWLRSTRPPPAVRDPKARLIAALGDRALRCRAAAVGARTSAYLVGVYGFDGDGPSYGRRLRRWMHAGPDGTVLMCHPSRSPQAGDPIATARGAEYQVLGGGQFVAALSEAGIGLATGTELLGAGRH
jgi:predicted glycoside hydrolase/deacetylase ChbG (UPF0249 family)